MPTITSYFRCDTHDHLIIPGWYPCSSLISTGNTNDHLIFLGWCNYQFMHPCVCTLPPRHFAADGSVVLWHRMSFFAMWNILLLEVISIFQLKACRKGHNWKCCMHMAILGRLHRKICDYIVTCWSENDMLQIKYVYISLCIYYYK